ncbi:Phosphonate ABC transporter phosphate-binding periplasmic component [Candidatus Burkholderia humilis]|nr:Phosphonate ABC transporter phosphate-binding periplasmic component [Candidatus Burkholderia humilis]
MIKFLSLKAFAAASAASAASALSACVSQPKQQADYTAFRNSKPHSILVLPPVNQTSDINATYGMLSQMTMPLAEGGYYVVPVAEMDETFKHNGLTTANDIQNVPAAKLRQIFGADAALYTTVTDYGTKYQVIANNTVVTANAKLVDLRSGDEPWHRSMPANGKEAGNNFAVGGLAGMLATAVVTRVAHSVSDKSYDVAGLTSQRLLATGNANGLLYGPRSPKYGTE